MLKPPESLYADREKITIHHERCKEQRAGRKRQGSRLQGFGGEGLRTAEYRRKRESKRFKL
jgi:hypothetical protein